jgi:hypothetical protein
VRRRRTVLKKNALIKNVLLGEKRRSPCGSGRSVCLRKRAAHLAGAAKSREETPKEGDGIERGLSRYRTATTYTASHKTQVLLTYFNCIFPHNLLHFVQSRSTVHQSGFPATLRFTVNAHKIS